MSGVARKLSDGAHPASAPAMIPAIAALAGPERLMQLKSICRNVIDLSSLDPANIVEKFGGALILLEQGQTGAEQVVLGLAVEKPDSAVLMVSDNLPVHIVRALMKIEASDILPVSAGADEILESVERIRAAAEAAESGGDGPASAVCWAFRGAVGGAGVSTLAIESAFAICEKVGPGKVCLVDLNVSDGMVSSFLEAVPKLDLAALSAAPERLDARLLAAWCWQHEDGVSTISAPRNPDADALATEAAILRLLDVACAEFPFVLVDMPRHMMPWTKPILGAVDEAIIISELTVPSLHAAADMAREVDMLRGPDRKAKLVLNRMFPKKKFRAEFAVDKAEKAIDRQIDATITSDWDAARTAVNLGKPIGDVKPKSALVADVSTLVDKMMPDAARQPVQQVAGKRKAK
ncbi:Type II/IV secretion system ATPase TadZ/CpaE,associated with Flp pilus assembly [hydrothermal vent metagenome]|jgi:pilus assembly protein CpaE|uniref:Type II/IV secretion system ATPase TadZ/CpaE,associated with Flp pilus assembly n=1 Tax=hydrothermal vent metagenome TaxID=652676 RepID=A0A170PUH6_9ZZZZ